MKSDMINIFLIFPNFRISGVLSFAVNLVKGINARSDKYKAKILIFPNEDIDKRYLTSFCGADVKVLSVSNKDIGIDGLKNLFDYINSHDKAILFPSYCFNIQPILPFLHKGIKRIQVLHSDEEIYYENTLLFCGFYDHIVSVSSYIQNKLERQEPSLKSKSSMIQYGVDIPKKYEHKFEQKIKIVYFGRIVEEQKRVSRMLKIIFKLLERNIDFEWTFIGDGSEIEFLKQKLHKEIDKGIVNFLGSMNVEEIQRYISSQDIYILTSDYEGTPLALMESMGCGCIPVVNSIKSGIPEMIEHEKTGFIVQNSLIDEYVQYIEKLYRDLELRKRMSKNCYMYAKKVFDTSVMTQNYINIFEQLNFDSEKKYKEFNLELYNPIISLSNTQMLIPFLKCASKIAIFGWGMSGKRTYCYMQDKFPDKISVIIDDNKSGDFNGIPIITTKEFLCYWQENIDFVIFGAFQKVNQKLFDNLNIPYLRLLEVI